MNATSTNELNGSDNVSKIDPWKVKQNAQDLFPEAEGNQKGKVFKSIVALGIPDLKVSSAKGTLSLYSRDQADVPDMLRSTLFDTVPDVVVQPFSVPAIQAILKFAASKKIPVVVRGAGSSPFGGSMPVKGGIVLDMNTLNNVIHYDAERKTVKVEAGIRWADLDWFLEKNGMNVRSSPSSRFSTVGGWIACGGIGVGSVSVGRLIESVQEVEVVTSQGEVKVLTPKDPLFHPVFGSEGQLVVIASVTLQVRERPKAVAPRLVFFPDHESAIGYAVKLASSEKKPMDLTYFSPAKFKGLNQVLGRGDYPEAHGIMATYENDKDAAANAIPKGADLAQPYLSFLMWNERFFPMKFRKLGPGLMGSEVLAPKEKMTKIVAKALEICEQHDLEPMMEIHFLGNGDGMLLCYYITDQTKQLKYTMDSFRGLLISKALYDEGATPYSFGVWNHVFVEYADLEEKEALIAAKRQMDPANVMNRGKFPKLGGRMGGLPAALFSPGVLGSMLKMFNGLAPISAPAVKVIASGQLMERQGKDLLLDTADECAMCGACVGVCPAYLMTKDERVTARGKLLTARQMGSYGLVTKEHAHVTFLCMRCKACEQVCQSKLHLIPVYEEMERRLAEIHGRDDEMIKRFVERAENSAAYDALVDRGLVLGSPSKNVEGGN
jgi:FAD/FMN-containing dehydrogenase/ferredoxin